jgi:hypothetical protein
MKHLKTPPRTGLCQVYICHSEGFSGHLRPAHDTAPIAKQEMTDSEVRTLTGMIHRYMCKCAKRRKK